MSDVNAQKKSNKSRLMPISAVLILAAVAANVFAVYQRQRFIAETAAAQAEIARLSGQIDVDQQTRIEIKAKQDKVTELIPKLHSAFELFKQDEYRENIPDDFLPPDSRFLYLCQWEQYRSLSRELFRARPQFPNLALREVLEWSRKNMVKGLHGIIYIPDASQHRLIVYARGKNNEQSRPQEDVLEFAISGPGWTRYGWHLKPRRDAWTLQAYCNDEPTKSFEIPHAHHINTGGSVGHHQVFAEQQIAWHRGYINRNQPISASLDGAWLIMYPVKYELRPESGSRAREYGRHVYVALESDKPIQFTNKEYLKLSNDNDPRIKKMRLNLRTGRYFYDPE